ncbi:MAG: glycosyltransferase family 2 protein [Isosphaeraceae bacterium]
MRGAFPSNRSEPDLSVIVPLCNEEETVGELYRRVVGALDERDLSFELLLVDDGSIDATATMIDTLADADDRLVAVRLSRNFGHQAAVSAGIDRARGRALMVMDGDLQDPPELIPQFIEVWRSGYDVVYGVRRHRKESLLKRVGYAAFYRIWNAISDLDIPLDSGDFCLMDRRVVEVLRHLPERMRFVRGLRTFVGFRQIGLPYDRAGREAGSSKYRLGALVGLAVDGLVSFSSYPLRLVTRLGLATITTAFVLLAWVLSDAWITRTAPRGWASLLVVVLFLSSVQLLSLGIIGEYIRLIFLEVKGRPTYIVDERATRADEAARCAATPHAARSERVPLS